MSFVVLGMEMPGSCSFCDFFYDAYICKLLKYNFCSEDDKYDVFSERLPDCPLRPLPEKHGRLIDADEATRGSLKRTGKRLLAIDTAPTIVEAEGD